MFYPSVFKNPEIAQLLVNARADVKILSSCPVGAFKVGEEVIAKWSIYIYIYIYIYNVTGSN